jgi:hypothetical protein
MTAVLLASLGSGFADRTATNAPMVAPAGAVTFPVTV